MSIEPEAAAFPVQHENGWTHTGMSLRDYFAAKAMQALLSGNYGAVVSAAAKAGEESEVFMASSAYELADAMLAERAK